MIGTINGLVWVLAGYLIGATPWGLLLAKLNGVDIRQHGSGNIGATNVTRVLGRDWGMACFVLDFLKGLGPVLLARWVWPSGSAVPVVVALAAVVGHIWPVYLRFKGGKGVATSLGALAALAILNVVVAAVVWCVVFKATRYVSVASLAAAFMLPVSTLVTRVIVAPVTRPTAVLLAVIAILVIVRHRTNIARLVAGQENRFPKRPTGRILQR